MDMAAAQRVARSTGANVFAVPLLGGLSLATGALSTAIDCVDDVSSFSCQLGIISLVAGPALGAGGRAPRAANGTISLLKDAANAALLTAGFAATVRGLPSLWDE